MSINTITSNPVILQELKAVFGGGSGSGITSLASPDGNLIVDVSGSVGNISLAHGIDVSGGIKFSSALQVNGSDGSMGQVLTSQGASVAPRWQGVTVPSGTLKGITLVSPTVNVNDAQQITVASTIITGLTVGKAYFIMAMGTYNNRGTAAPVGNTNVNYSALTRSSIQLQTYATLLDTPATLNKVQYTLIFSTTAASASEYFDLVFQVPSGSNTISTDSNDYCIFLVVESE